MNKIGDRVGAIFSARGDEIEFLGYGTYQGHEIPPENITFLGARLTLPNPKILLDNGQVVWGCECWWGPEERIKKVLEDKKVKIVDIEEERKKAAEEERE